MTRTTDESADSRALVSLIELGRDGVQRPAPTELDQGLNALYARIAAGRVRQRATVRWSMTAAAAVVATLVALQVVALFASHGSQPESPTLVYEIEGGSVLEGGYLREAGHTGIRLRFSEGSQVVLLPGARGRLRAVDPAGARVAIENGTASFEVTPGSDRRWEVEAGPFLITVKGTVFTVVWDPVGERFELVLRRGQVTVGGPIAGGDLELQAGRRLVVDLAKGRTVISEERSEEARGDPGGTPAPPATTPDTARSAGEDAGPGGPALSCAPVPSSSARAAGARRWADDVASGQWDRVLEDVNRAGVDATLNGASSEDLFALADAARYRRRADLARAALLAQRRRFPDSPRTLDAIFLLGRVEEAQGKGNTRALAWYDDYLARAPAGAYAAEALGRKMTLISELRGPDAARPVAEAYLRRFPKGSYAGSARALLRAP